MEQKLELGNCYYKPAFFNMKIDLFLDLDDLNIIPEGAMGLYYHEYIHFIQDISTIYGLTNISTINYYIQACAHFIVENKDKNLFDVPIELEKIIDKNTNDDFGLSNFLIKPTYIGSPIKIKSKKIKEFKYEIVDYYFEEDKKIDKVIISFIDFETDLKRELEFGGNQVTEGMAYLCEQFNYKGVLPIADDYPYLIVQKIVERDYPEILDDKILIIAICDISLMTYHPGLNFIRILNFIKDDVFFKTERTTDEIYKQCLTFIKGNHVDFNVLAENVKNEIKNNFNADYYDDIKDWIDIIFDRIKIIRTDIPSFIIDLVQFGRPNENDFFKKLFRAVGSPLVLNAENDATIGLPYNFVPKRNDFNPGIFLALSQVLKIFYMDRVTPCELKQFCLKSKKTDPNLNIDVNCDIAPWKKAKEVKLCPVGQIWHHWALKDFSPNHLNII
jgi:hypothetical protein